MSQNNPLQNRATPYGEIVAEPHRGLLMGNRGKLHKKDRTLSRRRWTTRQWVTCRLEFNGRRRTLMAPDSYTELFFLDEVTALAAGHRPCGKCRREQYRDFLEAWWLGNGSSADQHRSRSIAEIDRQLHPQRVDSRTRKKVTWRAKIGTLPSGAIVARPSSMGTCWLKLGDRLLRWSLRGYGEGRPVDPDEIVNVLTPVGTVRALAHGYSATIHPSAEEIRKG